MIYHCPSCGIQDENEQTICKEELAIKGYFSWYVSCSCGVCGPDADSKEDALKKWNDMPRFRKSINLLAMVFGILIGAITVFLGFVFQ